MAGKTLIGGTAYKVSGGKAMIGGTTYKISKGKTLVGGTAYNITFGIPYPPTFAYNRATSSVTVDTSVAPRIGASSEDIIVVGSGGSSGSGFYGNQQVVVSTDKGITWSVKTLPTPTGYSNFVIEDMVSANGKIVVFGRVPTRSDDDWTYYKKVAWVSTNGTSWTASSAFGTEYHGAYRGDIYYDGGGIGFANGYYIAYVPVHADRVYYSSNGINWSESSRIYNSSSKYNLAKGINFAYGNGTYMFHAGKDCWTSTNLSTWTKKTAGGSSLPSNLFTFYYNNAFYRAGYDIYFPNYSYIEKSVDSGTTWTNVATLTGNIRLSNVGHSYVLFDNALIVCHSNNVVVSQDLVNWTQIILPYNFEDDWCVAADYGEDFKISGEVKTTVYMNQ